MSAATAVPTKAKDAVLTIMNFSIEVPLQLVMSLEITRGSVWAQQIDSRANDCSILFKRMLQKWHSI